MWPYVIKRYYTLECYSVKKRVTSILPHKHIALFQTISNAKRIKKTM